MAEQLGISEPTYRRYENDRSFPDIAMLDKIAKVLDKSFFRAITDGIIFTNNDQKGGIALAYQSTINQLSEKLIEQYEERLKEKDIRIAEKDEIIKDLKVRLLQN